MAKLPEDQYRIYLSASISNALNNQHLADFFSEADYVFHLPQKIVPPDLNHTQFPVMVYEQCLTMMEDSHMGLILLDSYGRDCAWESGWYAARKDKYLIGFVQASSHFSRDWMIKGGMDGLITTNPRLLKLAEEDPILKQKILRCIPSEDMLPEALKDMYQSLTQR